MITFIKNYIYTYEDSLPKEFMTILESLENRGQKRNSYNPITQRLPFNILVSIFPFFSMHIYILLINVIVKIYSFLSLVLH